MSAAHRAQPPYRRIVEEFRARIRDGELRHGERMPSVRQIAARYGVAVATATRVTAALRDAGLVDTTVGSGAVVNAHGGEPAPVSGEDARAVAPKLPRAKGLRRVLSMGRLVRAAIGVADGEGLDAVTMRRLASELGVGPMSLYRHVDSREELVHHMVDEVFGEVELHGANPPGWRAKLEWISRQQWRLCQRHFWLPRAVSFTRPLLTPNLMAHTEWTLRALDGLGLDLATRTREALTLHGFVITVARSLTEEVEAEQETGLTHDAWQRAHRERTARLMDGNRFPLLAAVPPAAVSDLEALFDYGLARHLDGFAALLAHHPH